MKGGAVWFDWHPSRIPWIPNGIGLEIEGRDISIGPSKTQPPNLRQDTGGGGLTYTWHRYDRIHLYAKALMCLGSYDYYQSHASLPVFAPGGGLEYRAFRRLWVRADYEYQVWGQLLGQTPDPQGFTVGAMYSFGGFRRH
jgi:hypothetical protein